MEIKTLADLKPDKQNARKHNPRNIGMIAKAIGEVGVGRSIVIDEEGNILAGNGTVEALAECGITDVRVIKANGNEIIAVQRYGMTEEQKKKLALYDNRTAELADWDAEVLREINVEMPGLLDNLFMPVELDDILNISGGIGPVEGEDDAPEAPEDPITKPGDLYILGEHRLLCGDCTDRGTVDSLMDGQKADMVFTDPPYGINIVNRDKVGTTSKLGFEGSNAIVKAKKYKPIIGDDKPFDPRFILGMSEKIILWGANHYSSLLPDMSQWLVWDKKDGSGLDHNNFSDCELAWTNLKGKSIRVYRHMWSGLLRKGTRDLELKERVHPTQKPVGLFIQILQDFTGNNELILDLYGGSGSTMIACEKLNRKCYMMEIDPAYCDVIVTRWEQFSGKKAELVKQEEVA